MGQRELLSSLDFSKGAVSGGVLDNRLQGSYASGSRNQLVLGNGIGGSRPWKGMESKGAGTGSRKMMQVGPSWGGLKDVGGVQGAGSFFEDIGRSRFLIGAGQPHYEGVDMVGITASTILQIAIAVNGIYSAGNLFQAGLPQSSAPEVAIVSTPGAGMIGEVTGPVSFKIARLRLTTGARSIASNTSAVLVPTAKSIRITFPLASTGQTHWRVFSTQEGFGGVGLHYALRYDPDGSGGTLAFLDIPEATVAAGTVDGIGRSLEFDYKTGDLVPEIAYIDDYPPPAGTHAVRLENVMCVLGAFGDSSTAVTSTNTGTVGCVSLPNFYESYKPTHRVYFPEQIVDHRARPTDSYCYIAHRNSITALQYVGVRDGPAVALTMILPDVGIAKAHNWCQVAGLLYMRVSKGGFIRMRDDGSLDYAWAAPIWESVKNWDDSTIVGWHPDTMSVVISNGAEAWSYCLLNNEWSPICYFTDAAVAGTALSCVNSAGALIMTLSNGGAHTAYEWDKGATEMQITSVTPWKRAEFRQEPRSVRVRELQIAFEIDQDDEPLIASIHRNLRPVFLRDGATTDGSARLDSTQDVFDADHVGDMGCVFGVDVGGPGIDYLIFRISELSSPESSPSASTSPSFSPSSSFSASTSPSGSPSRSSSASPSSTPSLSASSSPSSSASASESRSPSSSASASISRSPSASASPSSSESASPSASASPSSSISNSPSASSSPSVSVSASPSVSQSSSISLSPSSSVSLSPSASPSSSVSLSPSSSASPSSSPSASGSASISLSPSSSLSRSPSASASRSPSASPSLSPSSSVSRSPSLSPSSSPSGSSAPEPEFVQQKSAQATSVTLDAPPAVGNSLILFIAKPGTSGTTGVTGGGVTWTLDTEVASSDTVFQIWHGHNSDGSSSTVLGNGGSSQRLHLTEWSGLANSAPVVGGGNTGANDTLIDPGSINTPQVVSLVLAGFSISDSENSGTVNVFPDGFQVLGPVGFPLACQLWASYLITSVDDDYNPTWMWDSLGFTSPIWAANIVAFAGE